MSSYRWCYRYKFKRKVNLKNNKKTSKLEAHSAVINQNEALNDILKTSEEKGIFKIREKQ